MPLDSAVEEALERVGIDIHQVLGEFMDEFTSGKHIRFRHVVGTLIQPILNWEYLGGRNMEIMRGKGLLESYIALVRKFPHFREEELKLVDDPTIHGDIGVYVNRMVVELRGKSPE